MDTGRLSLLVSWQRGLLERKRQDAASQQLLQASRIAMKAGIGEESLPGRLLKGVEGHLIAPPGIEVQWEQFGAFRSNCEEMGKPFPSR